MCKRLIEFKSNKTCNNNILNDSDINVHLLNKILFDKIIIIKYVICITLSFKNFFTKYLYLQKNLKLLALRLRVDWNVDLKSFKND